MSLSEQALVSWGRVGRHIHQVWQPADRSSALPLDLVQHHTMLPYGNGRSYGDSCLNPGGIALATRSLDRFIAFDPATGRITCEAGVLFSEILDLVVPSGWFLPVTPGTRFVTVGGAIANDVHGKNHHGAGTLGRHVLQFELLRSSGERLTCSPTDHPAFFCATIGGLGLTGFITQATLQLKRIGNPWIDSETIRFHDLGEFFALCAASDHDYEYTVAWVDCASRGKAMGRGLFMRSKHAANLTAPGRLPGKVRRFPVAPPVSLVGQLTTRVFNALYYRKQWAEQTRAVVHFVPFFYPLDSLLEWNRMYGPRGFHQYQCVLPMAQGEAGIRAMLDVISASGMGSFLAVLKLCGDLASPGLLSFPMPGVSLALDFPNREGLLEAVFQRLDAIVLEAGGRLYPAKDGRMSQAMFRAGYPAWQDFIPYLDPKFSSAFWRRVSGNP